MRLAKNSVHAVDLVSFMQLGHHQLQHSYKHPRILSQFRPEILL